MGRWVTSMVKVIGEIVLGGRCSGFKSLIVFVIRQGLSNFKCNNDIYILIRNNN